MPVAETKADRCFNLRCAPKVAIWYRPASEKRAKGKRFQWVKKERRKKREPETKGTPCFGMGWEHRRLRLCLFVQSCSPEILHCPIQITGYDHMACKSTAACYTVFSWAMMIDELGWARLSPELLMQFVYCLKIVGHWPVLPVLISSMTVAPKKR